MKKWKNRKIKKVIDELNTGDRLIVPEFSRLVRSMLKIMEMLSILKDKEVNVYAVKGGWELIGSLQSKIMAMAFSIASETESDLISKRTKEALKARKVAGMKLGRPKGVGKSKLDEFKEEIVALLINGSTKKFVADRYKTSQVNLYNWLKKNNINVTC